MTLADAIDAGAGFLRREQDRHGVWSDFHTLAGASTEWVTAYVGWALADLGDAQARNAAHRGWNALRHRRRLSGGWGYNRRVPVDADSTTWALALAQRLGLDDDSRVRRGLAVLGLHTRSDGGVATFRSDGPIRRFTGLTGAASFAGWCAPHVCVTAAAASLEGLPHRPRLLDFLRRAQRDDGAWYGYWWLGPEYATALAVAALSRTADRHDEDRVRRALVTMHARLDVLGAATSPLLPAGSPFATASVLWALSPQGSPGVASERIERAVGWLLAVQDEDGGWPASALMRIPPPGCEDPDAYGPWTTEGGGGGSLVVDQNRLYTTATVVMALTHHRRASRAGDMSWTLPAPTALPSSMRARGAQGKSPPMSAPPEVVGGREEVLEVLRDTERFSSRVMARADPVLLGADPPAHTSVRQAVARTLSPAHVRRLEPRIRSLADALSHELRQHHCPDLVADYARPLPLKVMAELLGLDAAQWLDLGRWADAVVADGTGHGAPNGTAVNSDDVAELESMLTATVARRRKEPADDVLSLLLHDPVNPLQEPEVASIGRLLIVAGSETTSHLIGLALLAVLREPALAAAVAAGHASSAVDTVLRQDPPVRHVPRVTTTACRVNGAWHPKGTLVLAQLAPSAPSATTSPQPSWSLPFGAGPHACPGAALAMLEATVALDALLRRWPDVKPAEPLDTISMRRTTQLYGPSRLRVFLHR
jgi:cytochrome P450